MYQRSHIISSILTICLSTSQKYSPKRRCIYDAVSALHGPDKSTAMRSSNAPSTVIGMQSAYPFTTTRMWCLKPTDEAIISMHCTRCVPELNRIAWWRQFPRRHNCATQRTAVLSVPAPIVLDTSKMTVILGLWPWTQPLKAGFWDANKVKNDPDIFTMNNAESLAACATGSEYSTFTYKKI